jgi:hypothetical protein
MQGFGKIIETKILVEKLPPLSHCHFDQREKSSGGAGNIRTSQDSSLCSE